MKTKWNKAYVLRWPLNWLVPWPLQIKIMKHIFGKSCRVYQDKDIVINMEGHD